MPREKSRYRDKRSSSYSSESSYDRKKKSKHRRRSPSRNRSESSSLRRKRSSSRSKYKRRSYSRSASRDRYESKSRRRSHSRSKSKRSRHSRSQSQSSTHSRSKQVKSNKKYRRKSRSSSRSSSVDLEKSYESKCFINLDATETQVEKAIKAAEAAGVTLTKIPTYEYKEVEVREDMPTIHDRNVLDDINNDSFVQKSFTSSKSKKSTHNIVIDLNAETVKVPETESKQNDDSIINFDEIPSEAELKEMWIRKLYQFRKKMIRGEIQ